MRRRVNGTITKRSSVIMTKTWSWKNVDTTFHLFLYFNILINLSLYRLSLTLSSYFSIFLFTSIFTCLLIYLCIYLFMHLSLLISISLYLSILLSLFNQFIYPFHLYLSQSIQFLFGVSLPVHLSSFLLHIFSFRSISLSLFLPTISCHVSFPLSLSSLLCVKLLNC